MADPKRHREKNGPQPPPAASSRNADPPAALPAKLSLFAVACLFVALAVQEIWVTDLWWQLRTGQQIVANRALPTVDTLTYTVRGHEWIELRWIYCMLAYLAWQAGGATLLILGQTAVLAAALLAVVWPLRRTLASPAAIVILVLGIVTAAKRFVVRPELFSYLLLPIFLALLDARMRGRCRRAIWLLVPLQVLWVNSHTLFVFGPVLVWGFAIASFLQQRIGPKRPDFDPRAGRALLAVAVAVSAACWLNPYGHRGAMFPFMLFREIHEGSVFGRTIDEFRSPLLHFPNWGPDFWVASVFVVVSAVTFVLNRSRTEWARLGLWIAAVYLAGTSVRNIGLLAYIATWASLRNLEDRHTARAQAVASPRWNVAGHAALTGLLLLATWFVVSDRYNNAIGMERRFGFGITADEMPTAATDFLLTASPQPQVLHSMSDGGYLAWATFGRYPVYVDGRLEVMGEDFVTETLNIASGFGDWEAYVNARGVNTLLLHREHLGRLIGLVRQSPGWVFVHLDSRDVVYLRDIPAHAELIRKYRLEPRQPWTPRGPEPDESMPAWKRAIGGVANPWYSLGMARTFLFYGAIDNAARYLERAVTVAPQNVEACISLAQIYRLRGRSADAGRLVEPLGLSKAMQARSEELLASMYDMEGRRRDAMAAVERALKLLPDDVNMRVRLARICLDLGDAPRAVAEYRAALEIAPNNAFFWFEIGNACYAASDFTGAITAYRQSVELAPTLYQAQAHLGILLSRFGDENGARRHLQAALQLKPDYEPARRALDRLK